MSASVMRCSTSLERGPCTFSCAKAPVTSDTVTALARRAHGIGRFLADTCATEALVALTALGDARSARDLEKLARKAKGPAFAALVLMLARARAAMALPWIEPRATELGGLEESLAELRAAASAA